MHFAAVEHTQESVHFHCPSSCHRVANCCGLSLNKPGICRLQMLISGKNFSYHNIWTLASLSALFPPFCLFQLVCKMLIHSYLFIYLFSVTCPVSFFIYSYPCFLYICIYECAESSLVVGNVLLAKFLDLHSKLQLLQHVTSLLQHSGKLNMA